MARIPADAKRPITNKAEHKIHNSLNNEKNNSEEIGEQSEYGTFDDGMEK